MKLFYIAAAALFLSACTQPSKLELTVKAASIKNGVVILKQANEITLSENIKDGTLTINKQMGVPGYYNMNIIDSDKPLNSKIFFDVYLENGKYSIETQEDKLEDYPKITSTSKTQQQLSDYYMLADKLARKENHKVDSLTKYLDSRTADHLSQKEHSALIKALRNAQTKRRDVDLIILKEFTNKYPDNIVGAHLMSQQYYELKPELYYDIFKKFSPDVKNSDDGVKIGNKLNVLLKLIAGAEAPAITGNMPDGRSFNKRVADNKVTLVEFWRSDSKISRLNHKLLVRGIIANDSDRKKFGVVSVSIDTQPDTWIKAIKEDHMSWPQVSDLKGNDSPNVTNWGINTLPVLFLVDKDWHVIKPYVDFTDVDTEVHEYLKKHSNL